MKKYTIALAVVAALPMVAANAYESNVVKSDDYYTAGAEPAKNGSYKQTNTTRKNGGYNNTIQNNFYYGQPAQVSSYDVVPRQQTEQRIVYTEEPVREKRVTTKTYTSQERKYFLAHPFFQPLKGRFGSVTDFAYAQNSFKFDMLNGTTMGLNPDYDSVSGPLEPVVSGKEKTTQFLVKEDFSVGITDTLAVIGMVQYDKTKVSLKDWSTGDPDSKYSSSGFNLFGIGLQNRFVDNDEWIAMIAGYYQHQKDTANTFIGELKAGYKVDRTTIYGLLRAGYSSLTKGDIYGAYVEEGGDYIMLSYRTDADDIINVEGGLGFFSVLNKYFTLNGELIYGHYDWHEQLNIKGAFGWQPGDMFALNLYAMTSLYDSASDKTKTYFSYDLNPTAYPDGYPTDSTALYTVGDYKIKDYNEWKIGVQAILYF